jgi:hypothetical protein
MAFRERSCPYLWSKSGLVPLPFSSDAGSCPTYILVPSERDYPATAYHDPRRHFTVDLYDKHAIPVGSIRVYLEGDCQLLKEASDQTMLVSLPLLLQYQRPN